MRVGFSAPPEPDEVADAAPGEPDEPAEPTLVVEVPSAGPSVLFSFEGWWMKVDVADLDAFEKLDERDVTVMHAMLDMCTKRAARALELFQ